MIPPSILFGIGFGLITALCWGVSNFIAKKAIDQIGLARTLFYSFIIGAFFLTVFLIFSNLRSIEWPGPTLFLTLLASVLSLFGFISVYYGFKVGSLSVVSTISSGWAVVTVALSLLILHETPAPWQFAGIVMTLIGVMLVAYIHPKGMVSLFHSGAERKGADPKHRQPGAMNGPPDRPSQNKGPLGVLPAVCSVLFFGSCYFLMKWVTEPLGPVLPVLVARSLGIVLLFIFLLSSGRLLPLPTKQMGKLAMIGLLDAGGFIAFNAGINTAMVSLVSPAASLLTLVTVGLARFCLNERLAVHQHIGFWLTLSGVILLSVGN